jgi:hypothetical protein
MCYLGSVPYRGHRAAASGSDARRGAQRPKAVSCSAGIRASTCLMAHRLVGEPGAARRAYLELLRLSTEAKNLPGIGSGLLIGSAVESSEGRHAEAVQMLAAAAALRDSTGASAPQMPVVMGEVEAAARLAMGREAVEEALTAGRQMTTVWSLKLHGSRCHRFTQLA